MKYLMFVILLVSKVGFASIDQQMAQLAEKRIKLEKLNSELQKDLERSEQEKDLLKDKIQESRNAQLKERLKILQIDQQLQAFKSKQSGDGKRLVTKGSKSELELLHKNVNEFYQEFITKTYPKPSWTEMVQDLEQLYHRNQAPAYQVKLGQLLEKLIFESNQLNYGFEAVSLGGTVKTVEMIRFGHLMTIAKSPEGLWLYRKNKGFIAMDKDAMSEVEKMIPLVKSQGVSFIPQQVLSLAEALK